MNICLYLAHVLFFGSWSKTGAEKDDISETEHLEEAKDQLINVSF